MAVVRCEKGHYFDDSKFKECPHCKNGLEHIRKEQFEDDIEKLKTQMKIGIDMSGEEKTVSLEETSEDEGKTIGAFSFANGTQLVTGWLVCVKGPARGRDFRLFHGWNRIGRSSKMDIYIPEDCRISSENHAAVVFDDKLYRFFLVNEDGGLVYLNGEHALGSSEIKTGDSILLGDTELMFIAFCTEERRWEEV